MRFSSLLFLIVFAMPIYAQVEEEIKPVEIDSLAPIADPKYREDQFYATITYNLIQDVPAGYSQYSFSTGLTTGFLRDMPVNKRHNHSIALGLGYSYNNIKHNLVVQEKDGVNTYTALANDAYDKNKLVLHYLEVPLELRWRNSDSISHKFWRVYLGFKASYLFYDKAQSEFQGDVIKVTKDENLSKFVVGSYLSVGWNTWNFYAYYGLTPLYDNAVTTTGEKLAMHSIKLGLIFYIL
jgi:hypothetical protein